MMKTTTPQPESKIDFHRLRRREEAEVARWFDTFADPVYGFIFYRVGRDADLASDISQETFVTALETINRFDPDRGEMFPWLTHIARNCIRKALRLRNKDSFLPDFWETVDRLLTKAVADQGKIVLNEQIEQKETAELVRMALTVQTAIPYSNITGMYITIDLKPKVAQRLHKYTDAHPDQIIVVNFNRQIKVAAKLDVSNPTQLSFDLSLLDLSLSELEAKYFTTSNKRNNQ